MLASSLITQTYELLCQFTFVGQFCKLSVIVIKQTVSHSHSVGGRGRTFFKFGRSHGIVHFLGCVVGNLGNSLAYLGQPVFIYLCVHYPGRVDCGEWS